MTTTDPLNLAKYVAKESRDESTLSVAEAIRCMAMFAEAGPSKAAAKILRDTANKLDAATAKEIEEHEARNRLQPGDLPWTDAATWSKGEN